MRLLLLSITVLILISCGGGDENGATQADPGNTPVGPNSITSAKDSPSCTIGLGVRRFVIVTMCTSGYYNIEAGERKYVTEKECLDGSILVDHDGLKMDYITAKFSPQGCTNDGRTLATCHASGEIGNVFFQTSTNRPIGPIVIDRVRAQCDEIGGEFKVIKQNARD
jgi:hypothetical protein